MFATSGSKLESTFSKGCGSYSQRQPPPPPPLSPQTPTERKSTTPQAQPQHQHSSLKKCSGGHVVSVSENFQNPNEVIQELTQWRENLTIESKVECFHFETCGGVKHHKWFKGRVVDTKDDKVKLHYIDWPSKWDEWLPRGSIRIQPRGLTDLIQSTDAGKRFFEEYLIARSTSEDDCAKYKKLTREAQTLRSELQTATAKINNLQVINSELDSKYQNLQMKMCKQKSSRKITETKLDDAHTKIEELTKQIESLQTSNDCLRHGFEEISINQSHDVDDDVDIKPPNGCEIILSGDVSTDTDDDFGDDGFVVDFDDVLSVENGCVSDDEFVDVC